jgi:hypothetical protein
MRARDIIFDVIYAAIVIVVLVLMVRYIIDTRKIEDKQMVELQKEVNEAGILIDQLEQGIWNNERDLTYLDVQVWVLDTQLNGGTFVISPAAPLNISPENTWEKQLDDWNIWFKNTILKGERIIA